MLSEVAEHRKADLQGKGLCGCGRVRRPAGIRRVGSASPAGTICFVLLLAAVFSTAPAQNDVWTSARPGYSWSFPQDHWSHPGYRNEWWYFTGRLKTNSVPAEEFGYQFTFFRIGLTPRLPPFNSTWSAANLIMGHAAISDLSASRHYFSELLYREIPLLGSFSEFPRVQIAWSRAPAGTDGRWTLDWNKDAFNFSMRDDRSRMGFSLSTHPLKPLIFQGPEGYSRKGRDPSAASLYYSMTRLHTEGTMLLDGKTRNVSGVSWMDKEFGSNLLAENQSGWDWFSLQLDDGRDLMLYILRDLSGGTDYASATLISTNGQAHYLKPEEWNLEVLDHWTGSRSGARYPSRWELSLLAEDVRIQIVPLLADQENVSDLIPGLAYWEGAVRVESPQGRTVGQGYVELTGYAPDSRLPL